MSRLIKNFLFINLALIGIGCSSLRVLNQDEQKCIYSIIPHFKGDWYSAYLDFGDKHFSGLVLIKNLSDSSTHVVFMSETGMTLFDFEFSEINNFKVHTIIQPLNIPSMIKMLRNDFEVILGRHCNLIAESKVKTAQNNNYKYRYRNKLHYLHLTDNCISPVRFMIGRKQSNSITWYGKHNSPQDSIIVRHRIFNTRIALHHLNK